MLTVLTAKNITGMPEQVPRAGIVPAKGHRVLRFLISLSYEKNPAHMIDLPGKAIHDFHFTERRKKLFVHDEFGPKVEMPVSYYFRNFRKMPELERVAIEECSGKVLDIGAAAGSHALDLSKKGLDVTALEISPLACEVMKDRGVANVICEDFFTFEGQKFDTLLLLMNGIGISSTLEGFREFLKKASTLLNNDGKIVFDSCDIAYMYEDVLQPYDKYYGEINTRYEFDQQLTDWFGWLYLDAETMMVIAAEEGFHAEVIFEDENDQYLAVLTKNA